MIVCVCNVLTESDVRTAVEGGAQSADAVYGHHGCERECGTCVSMIEGFLGASCGRDRLAVADAEGAPA